jgi:SagB-type dehydrogenase family enzyme
VSNKLPSVRRAETVYGPVTDRVDPAELLHEASKLQPSMLGRQMQGVVRLVHDPHLRASSARAVRRHRGLETVRLPEPRLPEAPLELVLKRRRSIREFSDEPLDLSVLSMLLAASYGVTEEATADLPPRRSVPSAGALYPLELYVLARRVSDLAAGVYHYDPLEHRLERACDRLSPAELLAAFTSPREVADAAAIFVVAAAFWRSRFKYGLRAYRFTLLEAGHVVQNLLLAATAEGLSGFAVGGFFDARLDALLGLDGLEIGSLIATSLGHPR